MAAALARRGRCVVSRRVDFPVRRNPISRFKYAHGVARFVAISEAVSRALVASGVAGHDVSIVHSGVDLRRVDQAAEGTLREEFSLPEDAQVVGNVAHMAKHKGQGFLVEAMSLVLQSARRAHLFLVGDGERRGALERQVRELNVGHAVTFTGFRSDVLECHNSFDVFVMPSRCEGLCTSVLDALALRKAVVASDVGGLPEMIRHERTGLLVPPARPRALAAAILRLLRDRALRQRLGEAGRRWVEERFTSHRMVENTVAVYEEVL